MRDLYYQKFKIKYQKLGFIFVGNIGNSIISAIANDSIIVTGRISDLSYFYENCEIFICPLRFGGGIKTKILEAINHKSNCNYQYRCSRYRNRSKITFLNCRFFL